MPEVQAAGECSVSEGHRILVRFRVRSFFETSHDTQHTSVAHVLVRHAAVKSPSLSGDLGELKTQPAKDYQEIKRKKETS